MSDEVQPQPIDESIECSSCGRVGGPTQECQLCFGNQRLKQARHYTLTEERQGKNPNANQDRYGLHGEVGPKQVFGNIVFPKS